MTAIVQKIPFLRLAVALAVGICLGEYISLKPFLYTIFLFPLTALFLFVNQKYSFRINLFFGVGVHLIFIGIGISLHSVYNQKPLFYTQGKFFAEVTEIMQEKPNSYQSVLKINRFFSKDSVFETNEKLMVYFEKTEKAQKLLPGEIIVFQQKPQLVRNNNNPYEFDYAGYLARKKIYRQVYLSEESWEKTNIQANFSFFNLAGKTRFHLLQIYREQKLTENEFHVLSALTLGYKRGLDPEIKRIFSSAGAMHVLAVSGLHVGIMFILLSLLFGFLRKQNTGRIIFVVMVILALWSFAFITGLSPSVQRAATMFTFVVIGGNIKRRPNIYNSLAASAFFLLLINPNNLFEAGFQLSYSAVFGIVFLQPRLVRIFQIKNKILNYIWELLTVSIAAQIATFPATAFYFNQFPSYFWLSNLLVIPAVTLLVPLGLGLLAFHWVPVFSSGIALAINSVLNTLINFLVLIENLPYSVAEFSLSAAGLVFLLSALLAVFLFIETHKKKYFKVIFISLALMAATSFVLEIRSLFRKEIIVYNLQNDYLLIHFIKGKRNYVFSDKKLAESDFGYNTIKNTVLKLDLKDPVFLYPDVKYHDQFIYSKNGLIVFDGKLIAGKVPENKIPKDISPEIVVENFPGQHIGNLNNSNQTVISSLRYLDDIQEENTTVFYLRKEGAFRKKW